MPRASDAADFKPGGAAPPYNVPDIRIDAIAADLPIRIGYMRGGEEAILTFATESFIDELARALHAEPLAFRIGMLDGAPSLAKAIMAAATIGGWDGGAPGKQYGAGLRLATMDRISGCWPKQRSALISASGCRGWSLRSMPGGSSTPAWFASRSKEDYSQRWRRAIVPTPEYVAGMPRAGPMRGKGFERLHDVPKIEVELIPSDEPAGGISGLGMAVLAPAVANAIAAGTGRRLRNLPFDPMSAP